MTYVATFTTAALRDLTTIPQRSIPAVLEFVFSILQQTPQQAGSALELPVAGLYGAQRGPYRILYALDEEAKTVRIDRIKAKAGARAIVGDQ